MMSYKKFRKSLLRFISSSRVNLGRTEAKTRKVFIEGVINRIDEFFDQTNHDETTDGFVTEQPSDSDVIKNAPLDDRIVRLEPGEPRRGMNIGHGVHAMTPSESMKADEQLGRCPHGQKGDKNDS